MCYFLLCFWKTNFWGTVGVKSLNSFSVYLRRESKGYGEIYPMAFTIGKVLFLFFMSHAERSERNGVGGRGFSVKNKIASFERNLNILPPII